MKIVMITRLMSGFVSSIKKGRWEPEGTPAIYRMIDILDKEQQLNIIFTLKHREAIDPKYLNRYLSIKGLFAKIKILSGPDTLPSLLGRLRIYISELCQCWHVYWYVKKNQPDLVYIDRANILLAATIARFSPVRVYLRLLGVPPSLQIMRSRPALPHYLYRWAYRSPFQMVLCSRDGSPGQSWMQHTLNPRTPRRCWVNGVDLVAQHSRYISPPVRIVLMGRLNYLKRIDQVVDAILNLPDTYLDKIHVDVVGQGELFETIEKKINNDRRFKLHGVLPHSKILSLLLQNDILISLNTHGNLTNTVLEAVRCGLCLIVPKADRKTGIDVETHQFIPENAIISLGQEALLSNLTKQLQSLIDQPGLILHYQRQIRQLAQKIDTWDQRIKRERVLLKPYDLAIVISDLRGGGSQKVLERLLKQWVHHGRRIVVLTFDDVAFDQVELPALVDRLVLGGRVSSCHIGRGVIANIGRIYRIRQVIKQLKPASVLSFLTTTNILTVLATRRLPCRLIISERNDPSRQKLNRVWEYLRRKCYPCANIITANSRSAIMNMISFVEPSRCHYVPNPVVLPENIRPIHLEKLTIVAVGRLHRQKAYDVLIDAFALFYQNNPQWQLVILGEGALRTELESQIDQLGLAHAVHLKGYVDPFPYLTAAHIYAMPSCYEGMPNALLEAMAVGIPTVISDALTGPLDFMKHEDNTLVVPVNDAKALAESLLRLANEPNLSQSIVANAKKSLAPFSIASVLPQWEVVFEA